MAICPLAGHDDTGFFTKKINSIFYLYFVIILESMKKILLVGKQLTSVPPLNQLKIKDVQYFVAPDLKTAQQVFEKNNKFISLMTNK